MSRQSILRTMRRMRVASLAEPPSRAVSVCGDDMFASKERARSKGVFSLEAMAEGGVVHDIAFSYGEKCVSIEIRNRQNWKLFHVPPRSNLALIS